MYDNSWPRPRYIHSCWSYPWQSVLSSSGKLRCCRCPLGHGLIFRGNQSSCSAVDSTLPFTLGFFILTLCLVFHVVVEVRIDRNPTSPRNSLASFAFSPKSTTTVSTFLILSSRGSMVVSNVSVSNLTLARPTAMENVHKSKIDLIDDRHVLVEWIQLTLHITIAL